MKRLRKIDALKHDNDKITFALKGAQDEINFLRSHVAQLTQAMLPPSQEEAKAKYWWQFWK